MLFKAYRYSEAAKVGAEEGSWSASQLFTGAYGSLETSVLRVNLLSTLGYLSNPTGIVAMLLKMK